MLHIVYRVDMLTKLIEDEVIGDQQTDGNVCFANTVMITPYVIIICVPAESLHKIIFT